MDWSKIKTIFIISFLILDIYLVYEFFKIQVTNEYEIQTEASIEKWLKADEIEYGQLPTGYREEYYLKARPKVFKEEDTERAIFFDQTVTIIGSTALESVLDKPYKIKDKFEPSDLGGFIKTHILYGEQYRYWEKDNEKRTITYYQQYQGKPFYQNINGELKFLLNEENEIISYEQTYLSEIKELSESEKIIQPINAIETLYQGGYLDPKSKITNVELGYYTLVPLSDTTQVMNPAWCFVINDEKRLFVSAFEGKIVDLNAKGNKEVE
ncbi:two-component system regulatory protein YycI [Bacillus benzoevorans]|uniref:Regulatory protein YycI of two-component signal transduction system YycFG n=1 Tax=Bacillus benzoevorans TaxID=1456 RepID=A0A7X0LWK1_9BACI|nr:two-component system regulatory protein YycI [Bacillus benzoevorans]MBB6445439.1 regulatory protein YycI of two-component signal transduction system YycFG [Bacillus benzoevorans]